MIWKPGNGMGSSLPRDPYSQLNPFWQRCLVKNKFVHTNNCKHISPYVVKLGFKNLYNISMPNRTLIITKLAKYLILPILALFRAFGAYLGANRVQLYGAFAQWFKLYQELRTIRPEEKNNPSSVIL